LQPFLALTKSASSPLAAIDLIQRSTSAPNTYIFTELLSTSQISALSSSSDPKHVAYYNALQVFCYGTYADYISNSSLPPLNAAQTQKLRLLSLLTLAQDPANLSYTNLIQLLALNDAPELETLVIAAIYAGLVSGTLDPHHEIVQISSVAPLRDVAPQSISSMVSTLQEWELRCSSTLADLERQIGEIKREGERRWREQREWEKTVQGWMEEEAKSGAKSSGGAAPPVAAAGKKLGGLFGAFPKKGDGKRGFIGSGGSGHGELEGGEMDVDDDANEGGGRGGSKLLKKR